LMGGADVRDAAGRVLAVLRDAGRAESTVRSHRVVLDRFAAFLVERGLETASDRVCVEFVAEQTGVRLESLRESVTDRRVRAVRRAVVLMVDVLAGRVVDVARPVIPAKDGCPGRFRPVRDEYVACCRERGNAEATVATKDKVASRFLAYLEDVGVDDLVALGVRDVSGFLLRLRGFGLGRKTIAAMRSCVADFLRFLAASGRTPCGLAERTPPHRHVRHESEPHLWTADEIRRVLAVIDRQSVTGKRDYAMILMTARLGLRISDLRQLELGDLDRRSRSCSARRAAG
jgi:integrase/recombinase XerD